MHVCMIEGRIAAAMLVFTINTIYIYIYISCEIPRYAREKESELVNCGLPNRMGRSELQI